MMVMVMVMMMMMMMMIMIMMMLMMMMILKKSKIIFPFNNNVLAVDRGKAEELIRLADFFKIRLLSRYW